MFDLCCGWKFIFCRGGISDIEFMTKAVKESIKNPPNICRKSRSRFKECRGNVRKESSQNLETFIKNLWGFWKAAKRLIIIQKYAQNSRNRINDSKNRKESPTKTLQWIQDWNDQESCENPQTLPSISSKLAKKSKTK